MTPIGAQHSRRPPGDDRAPVTSRRGDIKTSQCTAPPDPLPDSFADSANNVIGNVGQVDPSVRPALPPTSLSVDQGTYQGTRNPSLFPCLPCSDRHLDLDLCAVARSAQQNRMIYHRQRAEPCRAEPGPLVLQQRAYFLPQPGDRERGAAFSFSGGQSGGRGGGRGGDRVGGTG